MKKKLFLLLLIIINMANINAQHFCGAIDCDDYIRDECKRTTPNSWSDSLLLLPSVNSIRSSFSGFEPAVYVANSGMYARTFSVEYSDFSDNVKGILAQNTGYATITDNTFNVGSDEDCSFGVYLDRVSYFDVEDNTFTGATTSVSNNYGIVVRNSASFNDIYHNSFINLHCGNVALGNNFTENNCGLTYTCNTNLNNVNDFCIFKDGDVNGIAGCQGSLLVPAGNTFSGSNYHIYNNGIGTSQMMAESVVMAIGEPSLKVPQCLTMPPSLIITQPTRGTELEYIPFPTSDAVWSVNDTKYGMFGDTIIDGMQYAKVYRQTSFSPFEFDINNAEYFCAIRNDIENKQVYGIYREQLPVINAIGIEMEYITKELLLYDFSLNVGETIEVSSFECADLLGYIQCGRFRRVDDISLAITNKDFIHIHNNDSIVIMENGEQRKRILMEAEDLPNATHFWIEGIGSSNGPMNFFIPDNWEESMRRLLCFSQNDELLFSQDYYEYDDALDCFSLGRGSGIDESSQSDIYVYPNPANDNLTISLAGNCSSIEIYDSFGRIMTSRQVNVTTSQQVVDVDISEYPSGLYLVIVKGDGEKYYERIVKN